MGLLSDAIKEDHRELEAYHKHIVTSTDIDEQARFQNLFVWELARHAISEELVIYPALEKEVFDGKALADRDRTEHQAVKEKLYEFQNLDSQDAAFEPTLESLMKDLRRHIKEEEEDDLVRLEEALGSDRSKAMASSFELTKRFTPTRSHPSAPDKPPFETVVGLMAAPLDKLRDIFAKFPTEEEKAKAKGEL
ncbi:putative hexaprenyl pyrophosphate synthase, mitochondrial [Colletotrichum spaethianum]|uniref:Hexaprenyl pyrophosphate synthase, mitochondrial n=1 Tax=Colletotrichum spaethianum TaxID=700344 RepID=A0AA37P627_9PEZI|nr:putative hexaprenyl pyrophosphate synthase, mitochondrial [Colletotrichum spaethianum]GKT45321.1 putative hexaprenyl pyrophosphate synthase, mitochondrial [Colletotrichum spaethianum]